MVASAFLAGHGAPGHRVLRWSTGSGWRTSSARRPIALPSVRLLLAIGLAIVGALLVARQIVAGLTGDERGLREATTALSPGRWRRQFWGCGSSAAWSCRPCSSSLPVDRPAGRPSFAASLLALGGILLDRFLFVAAGQIAPITAGAGTVSLPVRALLARRRSRSRSSSAPAPSWPSSTRSPSATSTWASPTCTSSSSFPWIKRHEATTMTTRPTRRRRPRSSPLRRPSARGRDRRDHRGAGAES